MVKIRGTRGRSLAIFLTLRAAASLASRATHPSSLCSSRQSTAAPPSIPNQNTGRRSLRRSHRFVAMQRRTFTPKSSSVSADSSLPFSLLLSSSLPALLLLQCLASFPIDSASASFVAVPHVNRRRTCRSAGGLDLRDPWRPAIIVEMQPQDGHAWRQQPLRQCCRARSRMKTEQAPCVMPTASHHAGAAGRAAPVITQVRLVARRPSAVRACATVTIVADDGRQRRRPYRASAHWAKGSHLVLTRAPVLASSEILAGSCTG
jgi:hypothetical protein